MSRNSSGSRYGTDYVYSPISSNLGNGYTDGILFI